jgi:hypothetical protein
MSAESKPRYRTPTTSVYVDVSLDEFELEDIADYLRHSGYKVSATGATHNPDTGMTDNVLDPDDLDHIYTLAVCGQREAAQQEALILIGKAIGRMLQ